MMKIQRNYFKICIMKSLWNLICLQFMLVLCYSSDQKLCNTPQYVNLGETAVIKCFFQENIYGIYWYNSTDSSNTKPLVAFENSVKSGDEYTSGKYDVFLNGSLIINNVSLSDDHYFRVLILNSPEDDPITTDVRVYVVVKSKQLHPYIDICGDQSFCFASIYDCTELNCEVNGTKPATNLTWLVRNPSFEKVLPSENVVSTDRMLYSTKQKLLIHDFNITQTMEPLICKVTGFTETISVKESTVFVEDTDKHNNVGQPIIRHVKAESELVLACSKEYKVFILWRKMSASGTWETIGRGYFLEELYSNVYDQYLYLDTNGSLHFTKVGVDNEGSYMCVYNVRGIEETKFFDVVVFVLPDPPRVIVQGCEEGEICVIKVKDEGNLTCSVRRVRPKVELIWLPYHEEDLTLISFFDHKEISTRNGETYDVSVTSHFKIHDVTQKKFAVECRVSGWDNTIVSLHEKIELHLTSEVKNDNNNGNAVSTPAPWIILVAIIIAVIVVTCAIISIIYRRRKTERSVETKHRKRNLETDEEIVELLPRLTTDKFEKELKSTYKEMYTVVAVPFVTREKYCIKDFFVHRSFEVRTFVDTLNKTETWEQVKSHHDIFNNCLFERSRSILMGEKGFGKSSVTLQMAYEWCEERENTYMNKYDIFILLSFTDFADGQDFLGVVINVLLRKYKTTVDNLETLLKKYQTGLIILHGYDKVQDQKDKLHGNIQEIMAGTMFKNFHIMVTTSQYVPKDMDNQALHIRLLSFTENERSKFMSKITDSEITPSANATTKRDDKSIYIGNCEKVMKLTEEKNPLLHKLLDFPLFWGLFVKLRNNDQFFTSMTGLFDKIMSVLREVHAKNEKEVDLFAEADKKLARIAFDRLTSKGDDHFLDANELQSEIDGNVLDHYVESGILKPNSSSSTSQKYRFRHSIILEWYAATHVEIRKEDSVNKILDTVNPNDFPNVFGFMCGLCYDCAYLIIETLKQKPSCRKEIPVMCFLELEKCKASDAIKTNILTKMLKGPTNFSKKDTEMYQKCTLLLDGIGFKYQMGLEDLSLRDCLQFHKCSSNTLRLYNGLEIPILQRLTTLHIILTGQSLENAETIFQYCAECENLKTLKLDSCLLSQRYEKLPDKLCEREVNVEWHFPFEGAPAVLNLKSLTWTNSYGRTITATAYETMRGKIIARYKMKET